MANEYVNLRGTGSPDNFQKYIDEEDANLRVIFNNQLLVQADDITYNCMSLMDKQLGITNDANPEIGQRWFPLAIQKNYKPAFEAAHHFVSTIGRQKYILPVYTALCQNGYRSLALQWYNENQSFYHPIAAAKIRAIIYSTRSEHQIVEGFLN